MSKTRARPDHPTLDDVAGAAGVSRATAARALGGDGRVGKETRARILAAANDLGYRPNTLARSMITGTTQTIGVVIADIDLSFFARAVRGIADTAGGRLPRCSWPTATRIRPRSGPRSAFSSRSGSMD
jgi:LacI family transcriptional regulator